MVLTLFNENLAKYFLMSLEQSQPELIALAKRLGESLLANNYLLATAESCTGGGLAYAITAVPGSSSWFDRTVVSYSNDAKKDLLGVSQATLDSEGAVSTVTAIEMAEGLLERSPADITVAITGIAGPDGGTPDKPVGTVCFAWSLRHGKTSSSCVRFEGDRDKVRSLAILMAMQGLLDMLEQGRSD